MIPDLRKLIKYEEQLATNEKEDPLVTLYKRNTVSSRAKLDDKAKEKEKDKEQQDAQTFAAEGLSKQSSKTGDRTSNKKCQETAFSTSPKTMKRATSEKDMLAVYREQLRRNSESPKAKANPDRYRPQCETVSAFGRLSRNRETAGEEMIAAFFDQVRLDNEQAMANPNKTRTQRRSRSTSNHKYKHGIPIDICTKETSPHQPATWSNRLPLPSTRPVSSASEGRIN